VLTKPSFHIILLFFSLLAPAAEARDPQKILDFAHHLYAEKDYYRAITEYKRYLYLAPDARAAPQAALGIAESYLAGERWDQADQALQKIAADYPGSAAAETALLLQGDVALQRGDAQLAARRYARAAEELSGEAAAAALYRQGWALIQQARYPDARQILQTSAHPGAAELASELDELEKLPRKSPALAGTLSSVLPGTGQLYAGRPRDAAMSLLLNAAFILGAVESFENDQHVLGGILLFFEAGWYTGNIYNAANSAHKFNRDQRARAEQSLRDRFGLTLGRVGKTPMAGLTFRF